MDGASGMTNKDCIKLLEKIRWNNIPTCPYCKSNNSTPMPKQNRHHCNNCNTSYSVTVGTFLHNTKLDLQKWFAAIRLIYGINSMGVRLLSKEIKVNKNTAHGMIERIEKWKIRDKYLLDGII